MKYSSKFAEKESPVETVLVETRFHYIYLKCLFNIYISKSSYFYNKRRQLFCYLTVCIK